MNESIKQLMALQERDLELDKIQADLAAVPKEIAAIQKQIALEKVALEDSKKDLVHAQSQRKEKEAELSVKEEAVRKHTGELNAIKSNDAYRAMLGEIEKSKQEKSVLEDEILQLMDKVDQAQRAWKDLEAKAKAVEGERQQKIAEWESKGKHLEEQLTQKKKEREDLAASHAPKFLERYQTLRQGKKGAVIVLIKGDQCTGCHMRVSQNLINEVKRGQNVMFCEHCSRIVYLEAVAAKPS